MACDKILQYVLAVQQIYKDKLLGINWFQKDVIEGLSKRDIIPYKHAPPHREEGFINTLILDLVAQLVAGGMLSTDTGIVGFAAVGIAFKHEQLIRNFAAYISEMPGDGNLLNYLPSLIAESELEGVVPLVPFWQRAKAHIAAVKNQSKASLEALDGDAEKFPKLCKEIETRYSKELGFVNKVIGTPFGQSEVAYIKALGGTLDSGNIAEIVHYMSERHLLQFKGWADVDDALATPFSGFWRGLGLVYNKNIADLTIDAVKSIRDEALGRLEWLEEFRRLGGNPEKVKRCQFFVHNLCEMQKKQKWTPRMALHQQWLDEYKLACTHTLQFSTDVIPSIPMPRFASSSPPTSSWPASALSSTVIFDPIDMPVPEDGTSLTTYYYLLFCICPIQMK